jgi:xyloglucan-specific exo-beta-1,4-glucanase
MSSPLRRRMFLFVIGLAVILAGRFPLRLASVPNSVAAQSSQAYTWKNVVTGGGGGYIPGIVFNPSQQGLMYARTDIGGAYRWNASTSSWIPLMDWVTPSDWNTLGVESIATDPVNPNRFYVAAGLYTNSFTTADGAILASTDQGNTFSRTNLPFKLGGNMPGRSMGERLAIDPNLDSTLYLGTRSGNGLWRSTDFGATWSQVTSFTAVGNYVQTAGDPYLGDPDGIVWETFDPRTGSAGNASQTIYVGIANLSTSIYRSTDAGNTWAAVPGQPTGFLPHHGVLASDGTLYITYNNNAGPYDGTSGDVWKFNTATGAWTLISPIPSTNTADDYFGYGGLTVDALHPQTIVVSALNSWWPDTQLFRSTNGGATWTDIWSFSSYPNRTLLYSQDITAAPWLNFGNTNPVPPVPSPLLGWMVGSVEIDPFNSDHMLYGTGATLYGTNNLTAWDSGGPVDISVMAAGIEETAVEDLISPPTGPSLLSALGDVGGFVHTSLTAAPSTMYTAPIFTSGSSLDYAELSPSFIVRVGVVNKSATPVPNSSGFSFNSGGSWFQGNSEPGGITTGGGTVAAAADASRVVWSPANSGVYVSTDNGNTWTLATGIPSGAIVASDRVNPMKFYGFANGAFYISTNGGVSFTATGATGLPTAGNPVNFKAIPGIEGDIWLAGGSTGSGVYGLWHSTNSGTTFTQLSNVQQADDIGFGMAAPGASYMSLFTSAEIGGLRGIYRSDNEGASWILINDPAHQYAITAQSITGDPRIYGRVYVSTNGRGIVYGDIAGTASPSFALSAAPSSVTINQGASGTSTITVAPSGGFTGSVALTASGLPSGVTASFSPASTTGTSTLTLTASSTATTGGATVTVKGTSGTLTATTAIGLTVNPVAPPNFSLSASPTSLTVVQGTSGTSTLTVTPSGGFTGSVGLAVTAGLPTGVTATFSPTSTTGTSTLTLAASGTATTGAATVTVTGTSGALSHTAAINLTVSAAATPNFSLSASPTSLTVVQGTSGTSTLTVTPSGGFTGSVALAAGTLPTGVTATFSPASTTGTSTLTLAASSTATTGTTTVTVTGTSGSLSHTAAISLTVNPVATPNFTLAASPTSLTVAQGASGTSTLTVTPSGGFTGSVALTAGTLPTGVTATFSPTTTTGTSTLTLAASSTATTGAATVTVTGTSGSLSHTASISLTVSPSSGTGGVTVTPVVASNGGFFNEEDIKLANTATLTALSITVVIQRTTGVSFNGQYNTVGSQITQSNTSTTSTITYTFTLASGQTLGAGTGWTFAAQTSGTGTTHPVTGDTYTVTYTTGGVSHTQSGTF